MTMLRRLLSILALLSLAACGGGGGNAGSSGFGGGGGGTGGGGGGTTPTASDLVLVLNSSTITSIGGGAVTATVTAVDANRNTVANVPVTFSVDNNGVVSAAGTATDASGSLTATVTIGSDTTNRTITVSVASGTLTKSLPLQVTSSAPSGGAASLAVALSSSEITGAAPATVTVTLKDNQGNALGNTVVNLTTARGTLATPAVASLLTSAAGTASTTLRSTGSGIQGADQLIATAAVGGGTVQGQASFNVQADSPTLSISPSTQDIRFSAGGGTVTVVARDAAGAAVKDVLVNFAASGGLVSVNPLAALTDATGTAQTSVKPLTPSNSGLEIVSASATISGRSQLSRATVQVIGEAPDIAVSSVGSSTISSTAPSSLTVVAKDLQGNPLRNAVVTFSSGSGLVTFTPATRSTNDRGEASTIVAPATAASNGAEVVTASVTEQGVSATAQQLFQVTASTPTGTPTLSLSLDKTSISAASPATVTATLRDAQGVGIPGQVITFSAARGLATTNVVTALTQSDPANLGKAIVLLSPTSASSAGADDISASVNYAGVLLTRSQGFQVQATAVTLDNLVAGSTPLSAYGQTNLTLSLTGASVTSPVNISVTSSCVSLGKATLSPSSFTATSGTVTMQYRDSGCGAVQNGDQLQAVVTATGTTRSLSLPINPPADSSIAFVSAAPEQIYLRGSGFTETSLVTFEARDTAGNPLPNKSVQLTLQTGAGGVTMQGNAVGVPVSLETNAQGRVSVRVNSGSLPTPVRVRAEIVGASPAIATVSSNLSVAVGLPSQLNFSFSQGTRNIEGYDIDGTPNTYQIIAADRNGNPVPNGTSINFVTEGGQIEAIKQTQLQGGIARTVANFVSAEPRPVDGRVTVTTYALGEESFLDTNGNNSRDPTEHFQDLGNIFKDRNFDGIFDAQIDEFIPLAVNNSAACTVPGNGLLLLDASIPSMPQTCDGAWSGAGQIYVRRALQTVLSTSAARPLWASTAGLAATCTASQLTMQIGPNPSQTGDFLVAGNDTWYGGGAGTLAFIAADANPGDPARGLRPRLNPMAAGSVISATSPTPGLTVSVGGGSPVPSTTEASSASVVYTFTDPLVSSGIVFVNFRSPSGLTTSIGVPVVRGSRPSVCPL